MNPINEFYDKAETEIKEAMESVANSDWSYRIRRSQIRHLMYFNGEKDNFSHSQYREFFTRIRSR